jgi:predicted O-methyltransferase YrrM
MPSVELVLTKEGNYFSPNDPGERCYGDKTPRRSVAPAEAEILMDLAADRKVLEIGTGLGFSTRAMARTALAVVTIDDDPWVAENVELPDNVLRLTCFAVKGRFDLVFVDGDHRYEQVVHDLRFALDNLARSGVIAVHDTNINDVARATAELLGQSTKDFGGPCMLAVWEIEE